MGNPEMYTLYFASKIIDLWKILLLNFVSEYQTLRLKAFSHTYINISELELIPAKIL